MINLTTTKISEVKRLVTQIPMNELKQQYKLYNSLQSRGVKDEVILDLLERELDIRKAK